jgi:hypothetical protein
MTILQEHCSTYEPLRVHSTAQYRATQMATFLLHKTALQLTLPSDAEVHD